MERERERVSLKRSSDAHARAVSGPGRQSAKRFGVGGGFRRRRSASGNSASPSDPRGRAAPRGGARTRRRVERVKRYTYRVSFVVSFSMYYYESKGVLVCFLEHYRRKNDITDPSLRVTARGRARSSSSAAHHFRANDENSPTVDRACNVPDASADASRSSSDDEAAYVPYARRPEWADVTPLAQQARPPGRRHRLPAGVRRRARLLPRRARERGGFQARAGLDRGVSA